MNISNDFVTDTMQAVSDKSSRLTGNALGIAEELLDALVGHLHEEILVEPTNILRGKMRCDHDDWMIDSLGISLALVGCLNPQLALVHSFPLQVKFAHNFIGRSLGKTSEGVMFGFFR